MVHAAVVMDDENSIIIVGERHGVSRNIFIGIYSYVFRTIEGGVSHLQYLGKFGTPVFQIITGGKEFPLRCPGAGTCATSYMGGFVTMGGAAPFHGKVDR